MESLCEYFEAKPGCSLNAGDVVEWLSQLCSRCKWINNCFISDITRRKFHGQTTEEKEKAKLVDITIK